MALGSGGIVQHCWGHFLIDTQGGDYGPHQGAWASASANAWVGKIRLSQNWLTEPRPSCYNVLVGVTVLFEIYTIHMASGSGGSNRGLKVCHLGWVVGTGRTETRPPC